MVHKRNYFDAIVEKIFKKYPGFTITSVMDSGDKYIVSVRPSGSPDGSVVMDPYLSVSKENFSIKEYSPVMNTKEFREAQRHLLYKEGMNSA